MRLAGGTAEGSQWRSGDDLVDGFLVDAFLVFLGQHLAGDAPGGGDHKATEVALEVGEHLSAVGSGGGLGLGHELAGLGEGFLPFFLGQGIGRFAGLADQAVALAIGFGDDFPGCFSCL